MSEQTAAEMLAQFHAEADHPDTNALWLRPILHREEHDELIEALESKDRLAIARELADVVYVAYGTALVAGIDLDMALREVHRANMQKVREGYRREDGKIIKGPNFKPPDLTRSTQADTPEEGDDG